MMNKFLIIVATLLIASCENDLTRVQTSFQGYSEKCIDNVSYIVFTTGASVKYDRNGKIVLCQE